MYKNLIIKTTGERMDVEKDVTTKKEEVCQIGEEQIKEWLRNETGYGQTNATSISYTDDPLNKDKYCVHKLIEIDHENNQAIEITGKDNKGYENKLEAKKYIGNDIVESCEVRINFKEFFEEGTSPLRTYDRCLEELLNRAVEKLN